MFIIQSLRDLSYENNINLLKIQLVCMYTCFLLDKRCHI